MTLSQPSSIPENSTTQSELALSSHRPSWYQPTFSPEHGVYVVLFVSFLIGSAASQQWTLATTLAFIGAVAAFQAEHPVVLQIKQRRSWKLRFLVWGGIYAGISFSLMIYLYLKTPVLLWLYLGAIEWFSRSQALPSAHSSS